MAQLNRRQFMMSTAATAAGLLIGKNLIGNDRVGTEAFYQQNEKRSSLMRSVMSYRKLDAHAHVGLGVETPRDYIDFADRLGIEKLIISKPVTRGEAPPEEFKASNDYVLKAVKEFPDRFIGQMTFNVRYQKETLMEIDRRVDQGFVGSKTYTQVKINDPLFYPIIEKFIDLKMIMLMHAGIGKARVILNPGEPKGVSIPEDFVDAAKRYPEAMFQFAHLAGGVDWENACKALKDYPNVYADVSGSNNEAGVIDFALKYLGEDRLFFGCDGSYYQGVGHMMAANLTENQRRKIFFDNYNNILRKAGRNVD